MARAQARRKKAGAKTPYVVRLNPNAIKDLKRRAIETDRTASAILALAISKWIAEPRKLSLAGERRAKGSSETKQFFAEVDKGLLARLRSTANKVGVTAAALVADAVERYLAR